MNQTVVIPLDTGPFLVQGYPLYMSVAVEMIDVPMPLVDLVVGWVMANGLVHPITATGTTYETSEVHAIGFGLSRIEARRNMERK